LANGRDGGLGPAEFFGDVGWRREVEQEEAVEVEQEEGEVEQEKD